MLIAGETSGDTLGAELVAQIKKKTSATHMPRAHIPSTDSHADEAPPGIQFFGAGGSAMASKGVEILHDLTRHAVVGLWEVIKNYATFRRIFYNLLRVAGERRPDVIILIDYPGFNLRFAKAVKKLARADSANDWNPKIVYFVSPQIWAWHESRVYQIARDVDMMLSIFPFEKDWYAARVPEFNVKFVGHPLFDRFPTEIEQAIKKEPAAHSTQTTPLVVLLPGSRTRELKKHLAAMEGAVSIIKKTINARFRMVLPTAQLAEQARELLQETSDIEITSGNLAESLRTSEIAIASSGTVTMECAFFGVPTVVIYRTSWSTHFLGRRLIRVKYLAMPNLLADKPVYPELIQREASAENIARAATQFLANPDKIKSTQEELKKIIDALATTGASARAADAVIDLLCS